MGYITGIICTGIIFTAIIYFLMGAIYGFYKALKFIDKELESDNK